MNTKRAYKKIKAGIFILFVLVTFAKCEGIEDNNSTEFTKYQRISNILNMVSSKVQDNYKSIRSWEGKVETETDVIYEGGAAEKIFKSNTQSIGETPRIVINHAESIIEFSLDAKKNYLYVHNYSDKPIKYSDLETGRDLGAKGVLGDEKAILLDKEYYVNSRADQRQNNIIISRKAIKQTLQDCPDCQKPPIFDPRESFNGGQPVWEMLQHILKEINKSGKWKIDKYELEFEEQKVGDVNQYKIKVPGKIAENTFLFSTMVFSSEKGFNITLFQVTDVNDKILQNVTWDYELADGSYLPKETAHQNYMGKDGSLSYSKKMSFKNSRINNSIPAETFTIKNLGLKNGDTFIDKIEKKEYKYENKNLVFVADVNEKPVKPNK